MAQTPVHIALDPNRCDRCGACTDVCRPGAIKVGASYLYLDWRLCDECYLCVNACPKGAVLRRIGSRKVKKSERTPIVRRERQPVSEGWAPVEAVAVLAVVLMALVAKDALLSLDSVTAMGGAARIAVRVATLSGMYGTLLALLWFLARSHGGFTTAFTLGRLSAGVGSKLVSVALVFVLLVATRAAGWVYGVVVRALGWSPPVRADVGLTEIFGPGVPGLLLSLLLVAVLAPIAEELVFRGVLLGALTPRIGVPGALAIQAGLFALYHVTPWLYVPTAVLGLATGWLAHSRRSLWPAIALHALYNAVLVLAAFYVAG